MGKQLNYIMNYESFLELAQYALDLGCQIICNDHLDEKAYPCVDLSCVVSNYTHYYFYIPELFPAENIEHGKDCNGKYYLCTAEPFELALIEASFSCHPSDRARIYVKTGYYDDNEVWTARSELLTKTYEKIARKARKLAQRIV